MGEHSPGPWRWQEARIGDADGDVIADVNGEYVVCGGADAGEGWINGVAIIQEADARLISEAPALLALARYAAARGEGDAEMARTILARIDSK